MPHLTTTPVADPAAINYGYSVSPLIYEIRRERRIELIAEGFRLDDLKRWKTAEVEMPKNMLGVKWSTTGDWSTWATAWKPSYSTDTDDAGIAGCLMIETDRVWENKNYLYPIPSDQKQLNPNIGQNPGW